VFRCTYHRLLGSIVANAYDMIPSWTLVALQLVYLVDLSVFASRRISTVACVANIISDDDRVVRIIVWFHVVVDVSCSGTCD